MQDLMDLYKSHIRFCVNENETESGETSQIIGLIGTGLFFFVWRLGPIGQLGQFLSLCIGLQAYNCAKYKDSFHSPVLAELEGLSDLQIGLRYGLLAHTSPAKAIFEMSD